jgi:hypothetical protein
MLSSHIGPLLGSVRQPDGADIKNKDFSMIWPVYYLRLTFKEIVGGVKFGI